MAGMRVGAHLLRPVGYKAALGNENDGVDDVRLQPLESEVYANFGLAKALLVEQGRKLHALYCLDSLQLKCEAAVDGR